MQETTVILGAGHAGLQTAAALRELHYPGRIVLASDEVRPPYQRPPLSKAYLLGEANDDDVALRPATFFAQRAIELASGKRASAIDRSRRRIHFDDDSTLEYDQLVLATGARNRTLAVPGADLRNVYYLRTLDDASGLRAQLSDARKVVVIGAGFIGLEFAASAAKLGLEVTVLDIADRPMARAISKAMSAVFTREHRKAGVRLRFGTHVTALRGERGCVASVETADDAVLPADLVVIGIGVVPNIELATACGLEVGDGIVVDAYLQTSDPQISAIGDVAAHANRFAQGRRVRLESVQNAADQARCVAQRLVGRPQPYDALPWFWSQQGALKLQMAGLPRPGCDEVARGDLEAISCSVFSFYEDRLVSVESLNHPTEHMISRRLLATGAAVTRAQVADRTFDFKSILNQPPQHGSKPT